MVRVKPDINNLQLQIFTHCKSIEMIDVLLLPLLPILLQTQDAVVPNGVLLLPDLHQLS